MFLKWVNTIFRTVYALFNRNNKECEEKILTSENYLQLIEKIEIPCKEGNPDTHNLRTLLSIADFVPVSPSVELFNDKSTCVSFLSTTSQGLLDSVYKRFYNKQTIIRSYLLSTQPTTRPLNEWWSNDESIHYFLLLMKRMTAVHLRYIENDAISEEEELFINSYLYRLLISEYIELLKLLIVYCRYQPEEL